MSPRCAQVKLIAKELAGSKRRMLLVQAISQLRQRRTQETTTSLLNLLSCTRALPGNEASMSWTERGELRDIYAIFAQRVRTPCCLAWPRLASPHARAAVLPRVFSLCRPA